MIGRRLKALREEKELKQEDVAKAIGVTPEAIGNYENGKREPKGEILTKLADYFQVSTDYLLGRKTKAQNTVIPGLAPEQQALWNEITKRPELQLLHRTVKPLTAEQIKALVEMIQKIHRLEEEDASKD